MFDMRLPSFRSSPDTIGNGSARSAYLDQAEMGGPAVAGRAAEPLATASAVGVAGPAVVEQKQVGSRVRNCRKNVH